MEITDIRIKRVDTPGKLKAYVSVTFDDCFVVHNLKVISGQAGVFIAMPSRKTKTGEYKDIAHPINPSFRHLIQQRILAEFGELEPDAVREQAGTGDQGAEQAETEDEELSRDGEEGT